MWIIEYPGMTFFSYHWFICTLLGDSELLSFQLSLEDLKLIGEDDTHKDNVGNKVKERISKRVLQENKALQIFRK